MSAGRSYRRRIHRGRVMFVLPEIPDGATAALKNALAIRNTATRSGECPSCGATATVTRELSPGVREARMEHEDGCLALLGDDR